MGRKLIRMAQILIVGFGNMGRRRFEILNGEGHSVAAVDPVSDPHPDLCWFSRELPDKVPRSVMICTPPEAHLDTLREVCQRGAGRIFIEKPLHPVGSEQAIVIPDAEVCVGANWIYAPIWEGLLDLVAGLGEGWENGELMFKAEANISLWPAPSYERRMLDEMGPHALSILEFLSGRRISKLSGSFRRETSSETVDALGFFTSGQPFVLKLSWKTSGEDLGTIQWRSRDSAVFLEYRTEKLGRDSLFDETRYWGAGHLVGLSMVEATRHLKLLGKIRVENTEFRKSLRLST